MGGGPSWGKNRATTFKGATKIPDTTPILRQKLTTKTTKRHLRNPPTFEKRTRRLDPIFPPEQERQHRPACTTPDNAKDRSHVRKGDSSSHPAPQSSLHLPPKPRTRSFPLAAPWGKQRPCASHVLAPVLLGGTVTCGIRDHFSPRRAFASDGGSSAQKSYQLLLEREGCVSPETVRRLR